jgi:hypothetical protein
VRLILLPNLELYLRLLNPEPSPETQQNEMKRYEAWRVYGALQVSTPYSHPHCILRTCLPDVCCNLITNKNVVPDVAMFLVS